VKVTYDPDVDVLRILLSDAAIEESDEYKPGVILDYDKDGNIVGLEILEPPSAPPIPARSSTLSHAEPWRSFTIERLPILPISAHSPFANHQSVTQNSELMAAVADIDF